MWNGTAATLKAKPTARSPAAARDRPSDPAPPPRESATPPMLVVPAAPYAIAIPYRKKAEENAPRRKYLRLASWEESRRHENPARTYSDRDRTSSARNTTMRSAAAARRVIPLVANMTRA